MCLGVRWIVRTRMGECLSSDSGFFLIGLQRLGCRKDYPCSASTINLWCALIELRTIFDRTNAPIFYEIFISFLFDEKKTFIIIQNEYIFSVAHLYITEVSPKIHSNFYFWSIFFNRIIIIIVQSKVYKVLIIIINAQASFVQDKRISE